MLFALENRLHFNYSRNLKERQWVVHIRKLKDEEKQNDHSFAAPMALALSEHVIWRIEKMYQAGPIDEEVRRTIEDYFDMGSGAIALALRSILDNPVEEIQGILRKLQRAGKNPVHFIFRRADARENTQPGRNVTDSSESFDMAEPVAETSSSISFRGAARSDLPKLYGGGAASPTEPTNPGIPIALRQRDARRLIHEYRVILDEVRRELPLMVENGNENEEIATWLSERIAPLSQIMDELRVVRSELQKNNKLTPELGFMLRRAFHDDLGTELASLNTIKESLRVPAYADEVREIIWNAYAANSSDIGTMMSQQGVQLRDVADQYGVKILIEADNITIAPHVDQELVRNIIKNLMENGIKYSTLELPEKTGRYVSFQFMPEESMLRYRDNGVGMDPAFTEELGKLAVREGRKAGVTGSGSGWMITAHTLKKLGWTWKILSYPDKGTEIQITIPEADWLTSD